MSHYRAGQAFRSRNRNLKLRVVLVEPLPPKNEVYEWENKRDPEWVVDYMNGGTFLDTTVLTESQLKKKFQTETR